MKDDEHARAKRRRELRDDCGQRLKRTGGTADDDEVVC
jgi:hypothetical protein